METRLKKRILMSLPEGDRQGISGADAGYDSRRAVGGADSRQINTGTPELATVAQLGSVIEIQPPSTASQVAIANNPGTTTMSRPQRRMKWTTEINKFIMRNYYIVTKIETEMTGYRQSLFERFHEEFPDINVNEQRIADQRRVIVRNNLIPNSILEIIKQEVAFELASIQHQPQCENHTTINTYEQNNNILLQENRVDVNIEIENNEDLSDLMETVLIQYKGSNPSKRPKIPRINSSRKLSELINQFNNCILPKYLDNNLTIIDVHTLVYASAFVIATSLGLKIKYNNPIIIKPREKPKWQIRLEMDITKMRQDLNRLIQYKNNNRSKKLLKHLRHIFEKLKTHSRHEKHNIHISEYIDTIQQKLAVKTQRLKRYNKSLARKNQNFDFTKNEKVFYRKLNSSHETNNESPTKEELTTYWRNLWSNPVNHNVDSTWVNSEENYNIHINEMGFSEITLADIKTAVNNTQNWKAPGNDSIHNFWYKKLVCLHPHIAQCFNNLICNNEVIPKFFTNGVTYMIPKTNNNKCPSEYRPITCLPTIYKILTSCLTQKIYKHVEENNILTEQQKGCQKNHKGCKEQLIIDMVALGQTNKRNRHLHVAYIDYKKAYDSVPHSWLIKILEIYKIHPTIQTFLINMMNNWKTTIHLKTNNSEIITPPLNIKRGIFQGDSLSPLWFCLALNPLSNLLNQSGYGYNITTIDGNKCRLSNLLYMDDIKIYAAKREHLNQLLEITHNFSNDIKMEFGLNKCKILHIEKGKIKEGNYDINKEDQIESLNIDENYKYLGTLQAKLVEHKIIKQLVTEKYLKRLKQLLRTNLKSKNLFKAVNSYAIPILTYSFGIIKWTQTELDNIKRVTRTELTKFNYHHPKSAVERLTLPRRLGGRGLIDIQHLHFKQVSSLREFFYQKAESSELHKIVSLADINYTPLNLNKRNPDNIAIIDSSVTDKLQSLAMKELHGRHQYDLAQSYVDNISSNKWLINGELFAETEGFMIAIQDQIIKTKNYRKFIIRDITDDKCRRCFLCPETIQHITGGCKIIASTDYLHRHNMVARIIFQELLCRYKLVTSSLQPYYNYEPPSVIENKLYKIYFDRAIFTDHTIQNNRPDIVLIDRQKKTTYLIDIAVPNTNNLEATIQNKNTKYSELAVEIKNMWGMNNVHIIPIVISTTGIVPKQLFEALGKLMIDKHIYSKLQKAAILETCHIVRKVLSINVSN